MSALRQAYARAVHAFGRLYGLYIRRDLFLWEMKRWVSDRGDEELRRNYPLDASSVIFDIGGYLGDYAAALSARYGCRIYLFEPVPSFYRQCVKRFEGTDRVTCLNYGIAADAGAREIAVDADCSSFRRGGNGLSGRQSTVKTFADAMDELSVDRIDLVKINIEGDEFDLLASMTQSDVMQRIRYLQVQFHRFVPGAGLRRSLIRECLSRTHREMWNYDFVWESWELLQSPELGDYVTRCRQGGAGC